MASITFTSDKCKTISDKFNDIGYENLKNFNQIAKAISSCYNTNLDTINICNTPETGALLTEDANIVLVKNDNLTVGVPFDTNRFNHNRYGTAHDTIHGLCNKIKEAQKEDFYGTKAATIEGANKVGKDLGTKYDGVDLNITDNPYTKVLNNIKFNSQGCKEQSVMFSDKILGGIHT